MKMMGLAESGKIKTIIVTDHSKLGKNRMVKSFKKVYLTKSFRLQTFAININDVLV
ncbi:MAG: hypothetical protein ACI4UX_00735 [Clostridia bacterium]